MVVADTDVKEDVFDAVFHICTEISIEGREGKPVGTTFLIGDTKNVLEKSRQIILNPFEGHQPRVPRGHEPGSQGEHQGPRPARRCIRHHR